MADGFDRIWPVFVIAAFLVVALVFMLLGWRNRRRRQSTLETVPVPPAELGDEIGHEELLYVATTLAEQPLERVVAGGLGFRAKADLLIARGGLVLTLDGRAPAFIALADIRGVGLATWAIDKGVEEGGLVFVRWELSGTLVDSYLRGPDPDRLLALLTELSPTAAARAQGDPPTPTRGETPA